jgi:hypothetical protein
MEASVRLANISITRFTEQPQSGGSEYDGTITYRVKSNSIDFEYVYKFDKIASVPMAVANGAAFLKHELDALSVAAQNPAARSTPVDTHRSIAH